jgi:prepilin-type N-terminal cleavage/methylation domain-containing protein
MKRLPNVLRNARCASPAGGRSHPVRGFTLIELLIVLVIIATVAGLVIPNVSMFGRSADMAASAKTSQDLANAIGQYFVLQKRYPQGVDSLLVSTGINAVPTGVYAPAHNPPTSTSANDQISGLPRSSPNLWNAIEMVTLTSNQRRSFTRGGFDYVFDHSSYDGTTGEVNASNSGKYRRDLPSSGTLVAAVVRIDNAGNTDGLALLRRLVPGEFDAAGAHTPETGTRIVAVGVGPNCRLVPTMMLNTPVYPGCDGTYYGRYVAFFKVFESGERAILVGTADAYGRTATYSQEQFVESLPNGARQG